MSQLEENQNTAADNNPISGVIEELKKDSPQLFGLDYFGIIIFCTISVAFIMGSLWMITPAEDTTTRNMIMIQVVFALGLLGAITYYKNVLANLRAQEAADKEAEKKKNDKNKK
eukprot:CAMPEP_0176348356 /NCGR_PEP_ID=MMETSP0126-20121128/7795_1 /TAXON_ID=141414 ORGANISM="Strombidinopsis acuminatum, Strain SPMC142" /NCGR_SAMPLE_ID=MMETSP0126 /ASSEMBLY_ACC=CAM_ASM_000229 /LENGTH=113 /DNA_ID=CAMNT_0017697089 /DNA_START=8 /DNA_END=349 /DNA_ORIENTATION=-